MRVAVSYGKGEMFVEFPDGASFEILEPKETERKNDKEILREAILYPLLSESFTEFVKNVNDIIFLVNDGTRHTPTEIIFDAIYPEIKDKKIKILIGTGMHRLPQEWEIKRILGKHYQEFRSSTFSHDARDERLLSWIGKTRRGTEVWVNKRVLDADGVVAISSVEPHWFAGFTGGRKSFLPAVCGERTIVANHKFSLSDECDVMKLKANPVNEDMEEGREFLRKKIFSIMTVLDKEGKIYSAETGELKSSFLECCKSAEYVYSVQYKDKADIVVTVAKEPLDSDFFQARKALDNGFRAVKDGGVIILVAQCLMGLGNPIFIELLKNSLKPEDVLRRVEDEYRLGYHTAKRMAEMVMKVTIFAVTDIQKEVLSELFVEPFSNLQDAMNEALARKGKNVEIIFLKNGSLSVPVEEK